MDKENLIPIYYIIYSIYIFIWILFTYEKEENPGICNICRPQGQYAKWNKSDRERQILSELTYMWNLKKQCIKHKTDLWLPEVGKKGWGKWVKVVKRYKFSVQDKF